jgi:hypothetical protein
MIDKFSQTWQVVNENLTTEIERAQKQVLTRGLSHDETNFYRGYHAALLKIKALENPVVNEKLTPNSY